MGAPGIWVARHVQAGLGALGRLVRAPLASLLTVIVIGLALALPLGLKVFVDNVRSATGDFANAVDLTVYFERETTLERVRQLARTARERSGVAEVTVIPADEALADFREYSGFGEALEALGENPLPHALNVRPTAGASGPAELERLRRWLAAWPEAELVQMDNDWVRRFNAILEVLRHAVLLAAALLSLGVLAVIGNTIRLEILNRRAEIEVTKLVGGTNAFVRRPFLYTGTLYGLAGGLVAFGIVVGAVTLLGRPVADLAAAYGSRFALVGPSGRDTLALVGGAVVLGWLGAWLSAARHLRTIEPRA